jgi:regulator of RNase E activity RraB
MIRRMTAGYRALFATAALVWVTPARAQAPQASPIAHDKAAAPAKKAGDPAAKPDDKGDKADKGASKGEDKPGNPGASQAKVDNKAGDNTVSAVDRKEPDDAKLKDRVLRRRQQQDMERAKIAAVLRGQPMSEAMQQEMSRHARRLARLERIKALAVEAKDSAVVDRVTKLIEKENARHDKFTTRVEDKDDKGKDDKAKDDKGKDDKAKDDKGKGDKGKDDKGGVK